MAATRAATSVSELMWRPVGAEVARPRRHGEGWRYGLGLAGALRHGEVWLRAQWRKGSVGIVMLTLAAQGREAFAGGEQNGGGEMGSTMARWFGRRFGVASACTW